LLISACASTERKVERFLDGRNYSEALALLDSKGAGAALSGEATAEDLEARIFYADRIWTDFGEPARKSIEGGAARAAQELLTEGLGHCSWSSPLGDLYDENAKRLQALDGLASRWVGLGVSDIVAARTLISEVRPMELWLSDAPQLQEAWLEAWGRVAEDWSAEIESGSAPLAAERVQQLMEEFGGAPWPSPRSEALDGLLTRQRGVDRQMADPACDVAAAFEEICQIHDDLDAAVRNAGDGVSCCFEALDGKVVRWIERVVPRVLVNADLDVRILSRSEEVLERMPVRTELISAVSGAHARRARELAVGGPTTLLARVHLERARQIGSDSHPSEFDALALQVDAALASVEWPELTIGIEIGAGVPPPLQAIVEFAIRTVVDGRAAGWTSWRWVDAQSSAPDLQIRVEGATHHEVDIEGLNDVTSTYFSHFENVPNPRKSSLKFQLDLQEGTVSSAKYTYESALQSFNWNPTEWTLNSVNFARSNYNNAVNQYNMLVNSYNSAPALISRPVYLPYAFKSGKVAFGWELEASASMGGLEVSVAPSSVDRDFVRIGSKRTDKREEYRLADPINFERSVEASVGHLLSVATEVVDAVDGVALSARNVAYVGLSAVDEEALAVLLHPSGYGEGTVPPPGSGSWLLTAASSMEVEPPGELPPATSVASCSEVPPAGASAEELSAWYRPIICETRSERLVGGASRGSGVLVSGDGLILTCAHVVKGATCTIVLREGPWEGSYEATPLFVNERADLALLQAQALRTERWAPIRLTDGAVAGEEIIAIGNPGLDGGGESFLNVTRGIVSNPRAERFGAGVLVADVSVSSGSSGGPLIAARDGKVIGVVQAVANAQISDGSVGSVSSSGFTCLAAPATTLGAQLGVQER
jgi:hypothetical protein